MSRAAKRSVLFQTVVGYLQEQWANLPDYREGKNARIAMRDIGMSAFSVFFNQCPSFLEHQRLMQRRENRCNAKSLFGIEDIPSDNHIRQLLDRVPASTVFPVFHFMLKQIEDADLMDDFRVLKDQLLVAADGLHYFGSEQIHCESCNTRKHRDGRISYSHSMVSVAIVKPGSSEVLPLPPEFITPQDGHDKEDCERNAIKRWLKLWGNHYAAMGMTMLGDDLYTCEPVCRDVLAVGGHFIFTCKESSHKTLYEYVNPLRDKLLVIEQKLKSKNKAYWYRCTYVNQVPIKDGADALLVNWCSLAVLDKDGKQIYSGAFATDHFITDQNVVEIAHAGRTRWKIENEHNNTLKNHGYFLEHSFGHGHQHLASLLATLILLSFMFHTLLMLLDQRYQQIRGYLPRRMFFQQLRTITFYMYFASWDALMECMFQACELNPIDTS